MVKLPHFADKITRQIHKTALGAESNVEFTQFETLEQVLIHLRTTNTVLVALEQHPSSNSPVTCVEIIKKQFPNRPIALILGNEIHGVIHQLDAKYK